MGTKMNDFLLRPPFRGNFDHPICSQLATSLLGGIESLWFISYPKLSVVFLDEKKKK